MYTLKNLIHIHLFFFLDFTIGVKDLSGVELITPSWFLATFLSCFLISYIFSTTCFYSCIALQ